ncbi:hypothetical protein CTM88_20590 [Photobacterium aquimaris]|uniref:Uncharacterized protein n=1 Tax=Photobacterium aquimaris TaxID=512643 RepID=A0A2T3IEF3_9GAMM|nr:hypothetical protein AYY20_20715 [Photobacterium aquimaris]PSU21971.1 hypothetical protein CTM88_20590 [Photobacterium aquimaris]
MPTYERYLEYKEEKKSCPKIKEQSEETNFRSPFFLEGEFKSNKKEGRGTVTDSLTEETSSI